MKVANLEIEGYQIDQLIHKGTHFNIFSGIHESENRKVVIKLPNETYNTGFWNRCLENEFEFGLKLKGENIIRYYDLLNLDSHTIVIKEFFESKRLIDLIPGNGLPLEVFLKIAIQITAGLAEIHKSEIIHQSLKPSNILVNAQTLKTKIMDFGRSSYKYDLRSNVNVLYDAVQYFSPEQTGRMNRIVDYRTDFYSVGIIYYLMLTGQLPFESDNVLTLVHSHIAKNTIAPHDIKPDIPKATSDIILKLLEKDADKRYQSAEGLRSDLECCLDDLSNHNKIHDFVIGQKDYSDEFKLPQQLYGRSHEIEVLHNQFEKVCHGDTVILMVTGYSGIGKSTIVNELQKEITIKDAYFATGKYEHLKRNIAYSAIGSAFKDLLRQILTESNKRILLWKNKFLEALGDNGQIIIDIIPELALIIGGQPDVPELGSNETQNRFNMVFQQFISVFHEMAHPLVIFLDDLQWIDLASLNLIKLIASEHLTKSFFLIGAYRSNEVDAMHPAITTIEDVKKTGVEVSYINLQPLKHESINHWISDTLHCNLNDTKSLAELIQSKTNGNPFFIKSFLNNLYGEGLIKYKGKAKWSWNLDDINKAKPTDNVTELMANNINKLASDTREVLTTAACIGNVFKVKTLTYVLNKEKHEITKILEPAIYAGMILTQNKKFKFIHDKVLEAAYSLINEKELPNKHLKIGRLLLENYSEHEIEENLFAIVEHLNKGISLIKSQNELHEVLKLNIRVGKKAKNSAAYKNAGHYFEFASTLFPNDAWTKDYQLSLELYSEWAESEYMSSNYGKTDELFEIVLKNASSILDKTRIYKLILVYNENRRRFRYAVELAVKTLNELGLPFPHPEKITSEQQEKQANRFLANIDNKKIEELIDLPEISDPLIKEAIGVLVNVMVPYWNTYPDALTYLSYEIVNLSIEHGLYSEASLGFAMLGSILPKSKNNVELGFKLGKLALSITNRFQNKFDETAVKYIFYNHIFFWKKNTTWNVDKLIEAYHTGIDTGNNQWASYCLNHFCMRQLFAGNNLIKVKEFYDKFKAPLYRLKLRAPLTYFNPPRQATENLLGLAENINILSGNAFNEAEIQEFYQTKQFSAVGLSHICRLLILNIIGKLDKSLEIVLEKHCEENIRANAGQFQAYIGLFLYALTLLRNYHNASAEDKKKYLVKAMQITEEFKEYTSIYSLNYAPMYYLLAAEIEAISHNSPKAIDLYDQAIEAAKKGGFQYIEGIANELASAFWLKRGKTKISYSYINDAYSCYKNWACMPKIRILEEQYPEILSSATSIIETESRIYQQDITKLDIDTVQKATQTISSEIVTENLLEKLIQIIIENTGAQKGFIILSIGDEYVISAGFNLESNQTEFKNISLTNTELLPEAIVRYVIRTKSNIVLSNAAREGRFVNNQYIKFNSSKSVLSMPIQFKNKALGAIYLENNLSSNVFSEDRIKLMNILLAQAAISLDNARLFQERNKAIDALETERNFLSTAINTLGDTFYVFDPTTGLPEIWNKGFNEASGYSDSEIKKLQAPNAYYSPEDLKKAEKAINELFAKGSATVEINLITKDKNKIPTEYNIGLLKNTDGSPKYIISIGRDVSERKKAEEELFNAKEKAEESDRLKTEFINNMSHEIRTPMNGIIGFSGFLTDPHLSTDQIKYYVNIIQNSGNQLLRIIDDILEISKLGTKQVVAQMEPINLNDLLFELFSIFDIRAKKNQIPLYLKKGLSDNQCLIFSDRSKLSKIISNLLENAFKFTNEGFIEMGYYLNNESIIIYIKDTGIGIHSEKQDGIFQRFSQEEKELSQKLGGLGLGLSIAKENAELLGGNISLESKKGEGATFFVTFPYKPVCPDLNSLETEKSSHERYSIVVAEDEEINYLFIETLLEKKISINCKLIHAKNGQEAVEICKNNSDIDLILMDIKMPVMDGFEATKQIRTILPDTPIIAQTAYTTPHDKEKAFAAGCNGFISKPIDVLLLNEIICKYLT